MNSGLSNILLSVLSGVILFAVKMIYDMSKKLNQVDVKVTGNVIKMSYVEKTLDEHKEEIKELKSKK